MKNLFPDDYLNSILDVTPAYLRKRGLGGVILDIDNTLIGHNVPDPDERVLALLDEYRREGIGMCVVSNNNGGRVKPFCEKLGVGDFVPNAMKPAARGYRLAAERLGLPPERTAAIGDQIFTDVWGARRAGCYAVLLRPIHKGGEGAFIAFKRLCEAPLLKIIKKRFPRR